jgi:hypothetical protein
MSLADELKKLQELRNAGTLSEEEFAQAKASLLSASAEPSAPAPVPGRSDTLGEAAKTWVHFQVVMGIIGLVVAAFFFFAFWLPGWNKMQEKHEQFDRDRNKSRQEQERFRKQHFPEQSEPGPR